MIKNGDFKPVTTVYGEGPNIIMTDFVDLEFVEEILQLNVTNISITQ